MPYGYLQGSLIPELDLQLNLGTDIRRFEEIWAGWGYFSYNIQSPKVTITQSPTETTEAIRLAELDSHRTASPIDHPDASITRAKLVSPFEFTNLILEKRTTDVIDEGRIFYRTDLGKPRYGDGTTAKDFGITKLSELTIDVDKDWAGHLIKNLGAPIDPTDAARLADINPLFIGESLGVILIIGCWPPGTLSTTLSGSAGIDWNGWNVTLYTGTTSGSYARIYRHIYANFWPSWDVPIRMTIYTYIPQATNQVIWMVIGGVQNRDSELNDYQHLGFCIVDGTVYASVGNGSTQTISQIDTFTGSYTNKLSLKFYPGQKAEFYIGGSLAKTITTNLPSGGVISPRVIDASIYNSAAEDKRMEILEIRTIIGE